MKRILLILTLLFSINAFSQRIETTRPDFFTQMFIPGILNPADSVTYYFSNGFLAPSGTNTNHDFNLGYAYKVIGAVIICANSTTTGSAELSTLLINNITTATSSVIGTFQTNATASIVNIVTTTITGLSINVGSSDFIALQYDAANYATNPVGLRIEVQLMCVRL